MFPHRDNKSLYPRTQMCLVFEQENKRVCVCVYVLHRCVFAWCLYVWFVYVSICMCAVCIYIMCMYAFVCIHMCMVFVCSVMNVHICMCMLYGICVLIVECVYRCVYICFLCCRLNWQVGINRGDSWLHHYTLQLKLFNQYCWYLVIRNLRAMAVIWTLKEMMLVDKSVPWILIVPSKLALLQQAKG